MPLEVQVGGDTAVRVRVWVDVRDALPCLDTLPETYLGDDVPVDGGARSVGGRVVENNPLPEP